MNEHKTKQQRVVFGGGCFWSIETIFKMFSSLGVRSGYAGGGSIAPSYEMVLKGEADHAETAEVLYNEEDISFRDLLKIFFASHNPTTINKQGSDVGPQYRSVIFYTCQSQKQEAETFVKELENTSFIGSKIETKIEPLDKFYSAEEYHQNYYSKNQGGVYCKIVIQPKLKKIKKEYAHLLKKELK